MGEDLVEVLGPAAPALGHVPLASAAAAEGLDGGIIVTLLPDRGDRYLSTTLFRSVCASCRP